jgi:CDP-4-dehydro-6-deoxyglucose reductase/ferredoxin-NAD(P)+ reductase (naphthalene dioxygenase ferredoxin-specific)
MANRPDEPVLEFHVRHAGDALASRYVFERLRLGEAVRLRGPFGDAYLRDRHGGPIIAVAGGSGLAPMKSIVATAPAKGLRQPIHLYFGARDEPDVYLEDFFCALAAAHPNFRFVPVLSEPSPSSNRRRGLVTDALAADFRGLSGSKAYLAGPPPMVEAAIATLRCLGVAARDIHADPFYTEKEKARLPTPNIPA